MSEGSMVASAPSAWLSMEGAMARLSKDLLLVAVLTAVYVALSLAAILVGRVDLGFLLAVAVFLALRDIRVFCQAAMERLRQLPQLV